MAGLRTGSLNRRLTIERPAGDHSFRGAGRGAWTEVATVWASVQDALPSRGERVSEGINIAARPARVRIRYRGDVTAAMRFVLKGISGKPDRVMQIVAGPAELGWREGEEFMVEDYSTAGGGA